MQMKEEKQQTIMVNKYTSKFPPPPPHTIH